MFPTLRFPTQLITASASTDVCENVFLQEHCPGVYSNMVLTETLWKHLADIDAACREQLDLLIPAMAKAEDVTEALKASDQMEWARRMNNIRNRAEETVLRDLIYAE